jgi:hypothetical protein
MRDMAMSAAAKLLTKHHVPKRGALITWLLPVVAVLAHAGAASADPILYAQPPHSPVQSTRASQHQPTPGLVFQTFDSFVLGQDALITGINWQGSYFNSLISDPSFAPAANALGFTVALYMDNAGVPGTLVGSETFSPSNAGETFVGQQAFTPTLGLSIYNYSASLGSGFLATAGMTYWLSVYALSPDASPTEAQWGWNGGTGGNGTSVQSLFGVPTVVNLDRTFSIEGQPTPVPEPSTLLLLGMGGGALVARARRHRARK